MSRPRNTEEVHGLEKAIEGSPCALNRKHSVSSDVHMRIKELRRQAIQIIWGTTGIDELAQKIDLLVLSTASGARELTDGQPLR